MKKLFFVFFFFCSVASAQQAIQVATCGRSRAVNGKMPTAGPCAFHNPVVQGDLLVAVVEGGCGVTGCDGPVTDNTGQRWSRALTVPFLATTLYYFLNTNPSLQVVPGIAGNYKPFIVTFPSDTAWSIILLEYPPAIALDVANWGTYTDQNTAVGDINGQSSDWNWTNPLQLGGYGELIIGYGLFNACCFPDGTPFPGAATPGPGFRSEATVAGRLFVEDMNSTTPGLYFPNLQWNGYTHWTMGAVAFRMKGNASGTTCVAPECP